MGVKISLSRDTAMANGFRHLLLQYKGAFAQAVPNALGHLSAGLMRNNLPGRAERKSNNIPFFHGYRSFLRLRDVGEFTGVPSRQGLLTSLSVASGSRAVTM